MQWRIASHKLLAFNWFNTEIDVFVSVLKFLFLIKYWNWKPNFFPFCQQIAWFNIALRKQFWCKTFKNKPFWEKKSSMCYCKKIDHGIKRKDFPIGAPLFASPGILRSENAGMNRVRARLHEARSELKPVWDFTSL